MRRVFIILCIIIIPFFSFSQTKVEFIDSFREECKKSHYLRPIDSLVYIYTIMNLADKDCVVWERASVDYKRQNFFSFFIKPILACSLAIDRDGKQLYRDPVGEIKFNHLLCHPTYGHRHKTFYPVAFDGWSYSATARAKALIGYVSNNSFDYIFSVVNCDDVFWVIKDTDIIALEYDASKYCFKVYDANYFIKYVADDSFFLLLR